MPNLHRVPRYSRTSKPNGVPPGSFNARVVPWQPTFQSHQYKNISFKIMYIIFNFSSKWMRWCIFMCHYLIFWWQCSHNIPISVFCTIKLLVFEISTPDAQIRLPRLDDWCIRTTCVCLTRAACETEEGLKEGKRKRSHSFQVTEAKAEIEMFRAKSASHDRPLLSKGLWGRGALEHALMVRRGLSGKSGREIWIFAKLRHISRGFWQRGTLMAATWSES